jgi:hypothetical protein
MPTLLRLQVPVRQASKSKRRQQRLLYRRADGLTPDEVSRIVSALGPERVLRVVDRLTQPELPLVAAE